MKSYEFACNLKLRPITTILEAVTSLIAQFFGVKDADIFMEILPQNETKGRPFFEHFKGQNSHDKYDEVTISRLHLIFSRNPAA